MTGSQNNIAAAPAGPASGPDGVSPGAAGTSPAEAAQPQAALAFFDEEEGAAAAAAASQAVVQGIKRDQSEEDGAPEPTAAKRQRVSEPLAPPPLPPALPLGSTADLLKDALIVRLAGRSPPFMFFEGFDISRAQALREGDAEEPAIPAGPIADNPLQLPVDPRSAIVEVDGKRQPATVGDVLGLFQQALDDQDKALTAAQSGLAGGAVKAPVPPVTARRVLIKFECLDKEGWLLYSHDGEKRWNVIADRGDAGNGHLPHSVGFSPWWNYKVVTPPEFEVSAGSMSKKWKGSFKLKSFFRSAMSPKMKGQLIFCSYADAHTYMCKLLGHPKLLEAAAANAGGAGGSGGKSSSKAKSSAPKDQWGKFSYYSKAALGLVKALPPPSRGNGAGPSGNEGFFPPDIGGLGSLALAAADAAEQAAAEGDTPGGSSDGAPGSWVPPPRPGPPVPLPLPSGDDFADAARTRVSLAGGSFVGRQRTSGPGLSRLAAGLGGKGSPAGGGGGPSYLTIPLNAEAAAAQGKAGGGRLGGGGGGVDTGSLVPSKAQLSTAEVQVIQTIVSSVHGPDLSHVVQGILQHIVRNYHPHWHAPPSAPGRKGS